MRPAGAMYASRCPTWALEGNSADIVARLQKPDTRARILAE